VCGCVCVCACVRVCTGDALGDCGDADCLGNWDPQKAVFQERNSLEEGYDLVCFVLLLEAHAPEGSSQEGCYYPYSNMLFKIPLAA